MTESLQVHLLGEFRLSYGDTSVETISSPRLQSLLAYLLLHRDAPQARHHLAFLFWPDSTEARARTNLRSLLRRLRHDLPHADAFLRADAQAIHWLPGSPYTLDVDDFEAALAEADRAEQEGDLPSAGRWLEKAIALYSGDLLPSCYDDWIAPQRDRLSQGYVDALERLTRRLEGERDYRAAIEHAQRLLRQDPLHEATYRLLMRLHALNDDRASALRAYHTCVTVLRRELDVEPSPATRGAYERLLEGEAALAPALARTLGQAASSPLVGRHREWTQLRAAWDRAAAGRPHLALIAGVSGIGKTRLAEELSRWVRQQGMTAASARCYAAEGELAYAPIVTWLRTLPLPPLEPVWRAELARLLPELLSQDPALPPPGPMTDGWQRRRFFEALARAILGARPPLLLVLDDLQWCDPGTSEWLHYLLRFDPRARLLVVGTARSEELHDAHPLPTWMQALRHDDRLAEVQLRPLDEADTLSLAQNTADRALDPELGAYIYRETEGNPLYVIEMVRARLAADALEHVRPLQELPPRIQGAIEARLAQLSSPARALADLAATTGREFSVDVLLQSTDLSEDAVIRALDELRQRRIVREQGPDAYDFTHDKLREVAYDGLNVVHRRTLHRRVARALETLHAEDLDAVSAQLAVHYERAGHPVQAIPYYLRAGRVALQLYANEEAKSHYRRALAFLDTPALGDREREWRLEALRKLGKACGLMGKHQEEESYLLEAIALGRDMGLTPRQLARLYYELGGSFYWQHRFDEKLRVGREALALLGDDDESVEAALTRLTMAEVHQIRGDLEAWRELMRRIGRVLQRTPYTEELQAAYGQMVVVYVEDKDVNGALEWLHIFEEAATRTGDLTALSVVHGYFTFVLYECGDLRGSLSHAQQARQLALHIRNETLAPFHVERIGLSFLSCGDPEKAEEWARLALASTEPFGRELHLPASYWLLGTSLLCQGATEDAIDVLTEAIVLRDEWGDDHIVAGLEHLLGRAYLARGDRSEALRRFDKVLGLQWGLTMKTQPSLSFANALSGLEQAHQDSRAFRAYCRRIRDRGGEWQQFAPVQWYLKPAEAKGHQRRPLHQGDFVASLPSQWIWHDPFADCSYETGNGLEIHAVNGRDLWFINWSAPRLLRPLSSFPGRTKGTTIDPYLDVQTICTPVSQDRPAMGGLLLWVDERNYLRLDTGTLGEFEIAFLGCIDNRDIVIGRGRLPPHTGRTDAQPVPGSRRVYLRAERTGDHIRALCSLDGKSWFVVGQTAFPVGGTIQVGLYATGKIDRSIYHGAYPEGTAIRFESFQLWGA